MSGLIGRCAGALAAAEALLETGRRALAQALAGEGGGLDAALLHRRQHAVHGLAWYATYVEALRQMLGWARRLDGKGRFGEAERLILEIAYGDYLAQMAGGIAMSQVEIARPGDLGIDGHSLHAFWTDDVAQLMAGASEEARLALAALLAEGLGDGGDDDETAMVRDQFRRYADDRIRPHAQRWHLEDALIPGEVLDELAELGVFGLSVAAEHGGIGMSKVAMCVVTEELSRASIGVGSLATRTEIASELIARGGSEQQKRRLLPAIAAGACIPTAVFTEPGAGSDLGAIATRAVKRAAAWSISGAKTWITHAARADLMVLLARTDPQQRGWRGLSMFLAGKPRGSDGCPFPAPGMSGSEIPVLGYRGMKEYELAFDGFELPSDALLGGEEGKGFKQLMATFEAARIQTAARATGVAQAALELGLAHARERRQFGRAIVDFPRIAGKLAQAAAETMICRQLTRFAARRKDEGRRCDLEAGQAKLLAARTAWAVADAALQIHGGTGYALESEASRLLCDARILSIFEGTAEVQAQVIARRLLERA